MSYRNPQRANAQSINSLKLKTREGRRLALDHTARQRDLEQKHYSSFFAQLYLYCRLAPKPQRDGLWVLLEIFRQALDHKVMAVTVKQGHCEKVRSVAEKHLETRRLWPPSPHISAGSELSLFWVITTERGTSVVQ